MKTNSLLSKIYQDSRYKGKHIVIVENQIYIAKTGKEVSKMLSKLIKKYPRSTPTITYIPKADALILIV